MVCISPYDNITEFDGNIKQLSYIEKGLGATSGSKGTDPDIAPGATAGGPAIAPDVNKFLNNYLLQAMDGTTFPL